MRRKMMMVEITDVVSGLGEIPTSDAPTLNPNAAASMQNGTVDNDAGTAEIVNTTATVAVTTTAPTVTTTASQAPTVSTTAGDGAAASAHGTSTIAGSTGTAGPTHSTSSTTGGGKSKLSAAETKRREDEEDQRLKDMNDQMHADAAIQMAKLQLQMKDMQAILDATSDNQPTVSMNKIKPSAKEKKQMDAAILQNAKNTVAKAKTAVTALKHLPADPTEGNLYTTAEQMLNTKNENSVAAEIKNFLETLMAQTIDPDEDAVEITINLLREGIGNVYNLRSELSKKILDLENRRGTRRSSTSIEDDKDILDTRTGRELD